MALTQDQISRVWENLLAAETRSLYFGDLTTRYTREKQWITGLSFFLSSGAAATLIAKSPNWVPIVLATITAIITAYAMAVNLDGRIATMSKLHSSWNRLASDYDRLWNHAYDHDSEEILEEIVARERDASELAVTDAPNEKKLLEQWQQHVFESHQLPTSNGAALQSLSVGDQPR
jgi:hypothetical protein